MLNLALALPRNVASHDRAGKGQDVLEEVAQCEGELRKSFKRLCPIEVLLPFDAESLCPCP